MRARFRSRILVPALLLLLAVVAQGCQFIQDEFFVY